MTMTEWAKNEVKLFCEKARANKDGDDWTEYGCACHESALKAFEALTSDGHSGMSIKMTQSILNRMIDGKPLTPIEDTDDVWSDVSDRSGLHGEVANYQCKRMSSLFKYVYADGSVKYRDINRVVCIDINTHSEYQFGMVTRLIDEMFPITMPYYPKGKYRYVVKTSDFLYDPATGGDFDTFGIHYVNKPDGKSTSINKFFKEANHEWVEISEEEFYNRKVVAISNAAKSKVEDCEDDEINE